MKAKLCILSFLAFFYAASLFAQSSVNITFRVNITNYLNAGNNLSPQGIRIAGNFATYGVANHEDWAPWDPNGIMQPEGNNWWNKTITFPASAIGQTFQYKFVNGEAWGDNEALSGIFGSTIFIDGCGMEDGTGFGFVNRFLIIPNTNATVSYCWDECNTACAPIVPNGTFQYQISSTIQSCQGNNLSISVSPLTNISTNSITSITSSSALSGGAIINDGGNPISQRGVCWNTSPNPTTANFSTSDGSGLGNFSSNLSGLSPNTTYYVRAYAINSAGTFYGNQVSFTTTASGSITALNCGTGTNNGTLTQGTAASGVSSLIPYIGGNGGTHNGQTVTSTGVTGLTATLTAGTFANGAGSLTYTITGTPSASGTASFALNIGGQNCTLSRTVNAGSGIVSNPGAGVTFNGYTYSSVVLGNGQEWMAENLRTTTYRNGDPIPNVTGNTILTTGAWAHYNNNSQYENPYRKLYNWYAVADPRNVCPTGWHVPTDAEWNTLIGYLDPSFNPNANGTQSGTAGGKMKSTGTQYWQSPNADATNESGFSGLPGGGRNYDGTFSLIGNNGNWWSSTEDDTYTAWLRYLGYNNGNVTRSLGSKIFGFSVRCLRD